MLIAFEGIDGSGKTTHSKKLYFKLREMGYSSDWTAEPTDGPIGNIIRKALEEGLELDVRILALLFAADRIYHIEKINPLLRKGKIIISDRYLLSSLAYQGSELPMDWIYSLNRWVRMPDLVIYLDLEPEDAIKRLRSKEKYHIVDKLRKVRETYLKLIDTDPWKGRTYIVDTSGHEDDVFRKILDITLSVLRGER